MPGTNFKRNSESAIMRQGTRMWFLFKIVEFLLTVACMMLIALTHMLYEVVDDFTKAFSDPEHESGNWTALTQKNDTRKKTRPLHELLGLDPSCDKYLQRADHIHSKNKTKLSDFLVLYPSATTITIILLMEMLSYLLKDPMDKFSSLVVIFICVLLSVSMAVVSLFGALRSLFLTLFITCIFSTLLLFFLVSDFILTIFS